MSELLKYIQKEIKECEARLAKLHKMEDLESGENKPRKTSRNWEAIGSVVQDALLISKGLTIEEITERIGENDHIGSQSDVSQYLQKALEGNKVKVVGRRGRANLWAKVEKKETSSDSAIQRRTTKPKRKSNKPLDPNKVLDAIRENGGRADTTQIVMALDASPFSVRKAMNKLVQENKIVSIGRNQDAPGRGRKPLLYKVRETSVHAGQGSHLRGMPQRAI